MTPLRPGRGGGVLATILRYELRMLLRDRRTLLIAVVAPLVLFPAWILISRVVERNEERRLDEAEYLYAVAGTLEAWARTAVHEALALPDSGGGDGARAVRFTEVRPPDPDSALRAGDLHVVVHGLTAEEYGALAEEERLEAIERGVDGAAEAEPPPLARALRIRYRAESDFSRGAMSRLREALTDLRRLERDSAFAERGFPVALGDVAEVEDENVATAEEEGGAFLGLALTPFLLLLMLTGGSIVAVDAISGEKERGTLETLLTTSASRGEIVRAKLLAVTVVGVAVALVNGLNLAVYLGLGVLELPASLQMAVSPLRALVVFLLYLPLAFLVSGVLLLVSGFSKSYREYQIYFFPVFLVFLVTALAPLLPGMELRSAMVLVPVSGISLAVREVLGGEVDWLFAGLAFVSTGAVAAWLAILTERTLSNERLISRSELDAADLAGGAALFPRHVFRWFLGFWVLFWVTSLWAGESLGIRGQILVNLVGIFFGGTILLLVRYRLPVREALSLRAPHPAAWIATLVGAPAALALGIGVAEFVNRYVFPVPEEMLEAFGRSLSGPELPLWQLVLFLSVMPGVFEELAFRGALLHGVRQRMGRWGTVLVVGAFFGFFHVSLFRIVPTALLGMILAAVVLFSRSIYPAVLWHALNNALALVPVRLGWIGEDFRLPTWTVVPALAGVAVSLWILWRTGAGRRAAPVPPGPGFRA
ncbi:MAG: ABC transporter permease subunit/CPBP intramembrane protease [Longimicrobiales bacterium]|nr:ABC transporter permease subunit/CPBP intramembrane protease [Longimicrobiales bacterium]